MGSSLPAAKDDRVAAFLLQDFKAIATKEVQLSSVRRTISFSAPSEETRPPSRISALLESSVSSSALEDDQDYDEDDDDNSYNMIMTSPKINRRRRSRIVSIGSTVDMASPSVPSLLSENSPAAARRPSILTAKIDHHNWSSPSSGKQQQRPASPLSSPVVLASLEEALKGGRNKRKAKKEQYVGTETVDGKVRATLRKKFSWKQFPEVSTCLHCYD
jgi:hypothetical protein